MNGVWKSSKIEAVLETGLEKVLKMKLFLKHFLQPNLALKEEPSMFS